MKGVNSAFYTALQQDVVEICELVSVTSRTKQWNWVTTNQSIVNSGTIFNSFPGATASGIEESIDLGIAVIDFVLANSGGEFDEILFSNNLDMADVLIRRILINSPELDEMIIFRGKIGDYSTNRQQISGRVRNLFHGINIQWPYYTYTNQCVWRFGSIPCAFDTSSVTIIGSIESSTDRLHILLSSGTITASGFSDGHFDKGKFTYTNGQNSGEVRSVMSQSGDEILLTHPLPFAVNSNESFSLFPGCRKRLFEDCTSKYDNSSNWLGFPWIPRQEQAF